MITAGQIRQALADLGTVISEGGKNLADDVVFIDDSLNIVAAADPAIAGDIMLAELLVSLVGWGVGHMRPVQPGEGLGGPNFSNTREEG